MDISIIAKWLEVTKAQRTREAKNIEEKYGTEVAKPIRAEIAAIDQVMNSVRAMPVTPLEEWIDGQKKKGSK